MSGTLGPSIRKAKLRPPVVAADLVARRRLSDALGDALAGPLTLVCAPAGYGKTSLVSAHVRSLDCPVAWVSLDEGDASSQRLTLLIAAAVRRSVPDAFAELETYLASHPDVRALASWLADAMDELDTDFVLVLDELERVGSADVHGLVTSLLEYPPELMHLVVTTRHDPPWPLASLRARGSLREIRQADLAFHAEEVRHFVERATGLSLDDAAAARIHECTEGWPAAVRMIALALGDVSAVDELLGGLPSGVMRVAEFLEEAVLTRQPAGLRAMLVRTSILERIDAELCDALHLDDAPDDLSGESFLEHVRGRNLFVSEDDGDCVRLHALMREFLRHTLETTCSAEEIRRLHDRARDRLDAAGQVGEAIEHALRGTHPASAVDVLACHRVDLMNADRLAELLAWLEQIRAATGEDALVMRLLDAWLAVPMPGLGATLDAIQAELPAAGLAPDARTALEGEVAALRSLERSAAYAFDEAARHAEAALRAIPGTATAARAHTYFAQATNAQAVGDPAAARRAVATGVEELTATGGAALATVLSAESFVHWNEGEFPRAVDTVERALAAIPPLAAPTTRITLRTTAGFAHYRMNALAAAESSLRGPGLDDYPVARAELARTLEAAGRLPESDEIVADVLRRAAEARGADASRAARAVRAELDLRRGDVAAALQWAERAADEPLGEHSTRRPPGIVLAAVLVAAGDAGSLARADDVLGRILNGARRAHRFPVVSEALAIRAAAAAARRDERCAVEMLGRALELTRRGSAVRTYLDLAPGVLPLLVHPDLPESLRAHARIVSAAASGALGDGPAVAPRRVLTEDLTNREEDVLELLAERLTNKEIAQRLHVASETVKRHLGNVYGKLHVHGRREAVNKARALGLLPPR